MRRPSVSIPGIGVFKTTYQPARINLPEGRIIPPQMKIIFMNNDGVEDKSLQKSYYRKNKNNKFACYKDMYEKMNDMISALKSGKHIIIGKIGTLSYREDTGYSFTPFNGNQKLGLEGISLKNKESRYKFNY